MSDSTNGHPKDDKRAPKFVASRPGRLVSVAGLIERVVTQFKSEYDEQSPSLVEADSEMKRLKLVRDVALYVFSVESVQLSAEEQSSIIQSAYGELFGYGPLDALLRDETITTIALEGADKVSVRYGPGQELTPLDPIFEDAGHQRRIIKRLLADADAELREELPIIETGLNYAGRRISLSLTGPPYTFQLTADIRLHPVQAPSLDGLVQSGFLPAQAAQVLMALIQSNHGFVIVGDTESGKTTLLSALSRLLPNDANIISVERSGELDLPPQANRRVVRWPVGERAGISFADCVVDALETKPNIILLDEVRSDESEAVAPLLTSPVAPRQIWTFRGSPEAMRIRNALGMVARRSQVGQSEALVNALYQRLPFIIVVKRRRGFIELNSIAEWQFADDANYPDFVELMAKDWEGLKLTGHRPQHPLPLESDFWR